MAAPLQKRKNANGEKLAKKVRTGRSTKPQPAKDDLVAGISSDAVQRATGKRWDEWFTLLDAAGAGKMKHKDIALRLSQEHGVGDWWCQMVTVGYEQARGLREKHQKADGYSVSASRVLAVPVEAAFRAFEDARQRRRWLPGDPVDIRRATKNKSMRITWKDGATSVAVNFYAKGADRSQVALQHDKLPDAKAAAKMKNYWAERMDALRELLNS